MWRGDSSCGGVAEGRSPSNVFLMCSDSIHIMCIESSCGGVAEEGPSPARVREKGPRGRGSHRAPGWCECESQIFGMSVCFHAACICFVCVFARVRVCVCVHMCIHVLVCVCI